MITETLGVAPGTPLHLTRLDLLLWGQELHFEGLAAESLRFRLRLIDCREARWQWYTHMQPEGRPAFPPAEIVDLHLGRDQHRSPLRLLTDYFGLTVSYGQFQIEAL